MQVIEICGLYINMIFFPPEALLPLILLVVIALENSGKNVSLFKGYGHSILALKALNSRHCNCLNAR